MGAKRVTVYYCETPIKIKCLLIANELYLSRCFVDYKLCIPTLNTGQYINHA